MFREFFDDLIPTVAAAIAMLFVIAVVVLTIAIGIGAMISASGYKTPSEKYFEQCIADGVKEYECYGIIYGKRK